MHIANKIEKAYQIESIIFILYAIIGFRFSDIISMHWAMLLESCDDEILCRVQDSSKAVARMFTLIRKLYKLMHFGYLELL